MNIHYDGQNWAKMYCLFRHYSLPLGIKRNQNGVHCIRQIEAPSTACTLEMMSISSRDRSWPDDNLRYISTGTLTLSWKGKGGGAARDQIYPNISPKEIHSLTVHHKAIDKQNHIQWISNKKKIQNTTFGMTIVYYLKFDPFILNFWKSGGATFILD